MTTPKSIEHAWSKLARLAAQAPAEVADMPFGFATRVVAAWQTDPRGRNLAALEWLTLRALAVAVAIFAGSAALGYDTVAGVFRGQASLVSGDWLDILPLPL